jgi:hypothetical protein
MSTKKRRREHYVPKFYLDLFAESLFAFDKLTGKVFATTSKNIALEPGFYDLAPSIDLEGLIADNENRMKSGMDELVSKMNPAAISQDARIKVSLFVGLQSVRTREFRSMIQEMGSKLMTQLVRNDPRAKGLEFKVMMKDEAAQALQAKIMVSDYVPQIAWMLANSRWTLLVNRTKIPFWTSDNPVALFNPIDYGDLGGVGLAVRGIQTHFPLNGRSLLLILDPTSYDLPPLKIVKKPEAVLYENELQLYNATRFVFSSANDFSMAKKIREHDGTLRKPREQVRLREIESSGRSIIQVTKKAAKSPEEMSRGAGS